MGSKSKKDRAELVIFQRTYSRYLDRGEALGNDSLSWVPAVDIYETDEHYVLNAEVPGVDSEDIRVEVSGSEVSIRGERSFDSVCSEESYQRLEGIRGRFHRIFSLADAMNNEEITANLKDGVLQVVIPKSGKSTSIPLNLSRPPRTARD